ncbi:GAF and ANTAR domain-containing protein [Arthrobacter sp. NPDC092385]|uniref:GAF and ANTAR domain-containing protein n=1 Tax=Arthrobacter sp. NPDC092385 TaxID=3363943 RepID=UPI00382C6A30
MPASPAPSSELFTIFGRTKGYLLTEQTAHDAVEALAGVAKDVIGAAQGAGVSIVDSSGHRTSVGATDDDVLEADNLQYDLGDGPCISAWATGTPTYIADTLSDTNNHTGSGRGSGSGDRWQKWMAAAAARGVRSCLSVPLLNEPAALGAMKVYSTVPDAFSDEDQRLLAALARSAAALLGHIQASDTPQRISDEIKESLANRDTIGIARGILMERHGIDRQAAMDQLIEQATHTHTTIGTQAAMISERQDGTDPHGDL